MDAPTSTDPAPTHKHEGGARSHRGFPVMLIVAFLVLSACAGFAVIMTNGPDYRATAVPAIGGTEVSVDVDDADEAAPQESLRLTAALPEGPVVIGVPGRLVITVTNPTDQPIILDDLAIDVLEPSRAGCRAEWFTVGVDASATAAEVRVPAGESARIPVTYTLVDLEGTNQDACKGATFPLSISGSGRPV